MEMDLECVYILMEIFIKGNTQKVKKMEVEFINLKMEISMKFNGLMIKKWIKKNYLDKSQYILKL